MQTSRREAIKKLGILGVGLSGINVVSAKESIPKEWDEYFDAIVVGSGFAGSAAMLSLLDNGLSNILMIDKMQYLGGNSSISGGSMAVAKTKLQDKDGIKDDPEIHIKDTLKSGRNLNDLEIVKTMIYEGPKTLEWLEDNGVEFKWVSRSGGHSVTRSHSAGAGSYITRPLQQTILDRGGKIRTRVIMDEIIYDNNGRVMGIKVREKYEFNYDRLFSEDNNKTGVTKYYRIYGGLILATGGWAADIQFRELWDSNLTPDVPMTNHYGATAYTIKKLMRDNIKTIDMQYIQMMHVTSADEGSFGFAYRMITRAYAYGMMVNAKTGRRFVNEIVDRKQGSDAILAMNEGGKNPPILFLDRDGAKTVDIVDMQRGMEADAIWQFESLEDMITHFNINREPFLDEVKKMNQYMRDGKDLDFGRNFNKYKGKSIFLEKPPFFAARPGPKIHHCMGGVKTTIDCEVYSNKGNLVKGLYACGEVTGGRHGYNRLGSNSVLECLVYGKRAGDSLGKAFNKQRNV